MKKKLERQRERERVRKKASNIQKESLVKYCQNSFETFWFCTVFAFGVMRERGQHWTKHL